MQKKLLSVGSLAYDTITTPFGKSTNTLGGSAVYFSLAARFFAAPAMVGVVGKDFKKSDLLMLNKKGIDISALEQKTGKTFHWAGQYHFDMNTRDTLKTELGVFSDFKPKLTKLNAISDFVFLGNIHPKVQLNILEQLKNPKLVGLDTMNFWIDSALPNLKKVLKKIDVLIINDSEARQLSKQTNLLRASKTILKMMGGEKSDILVVKQGEHGLLLFSNEMIFNLPGYPLENVIDPTGAGDTFAGGFMGYLAAGDNLSWNNIKKACVFGTVLASYCVEKFGTKRLQEIKIADIRKRLKTFEQLVRF